MRWPFGLKTVVRPIAPEYLTVGDRRVTLALVRNPRARRYVLRLRPDHSARVTIPRGGSIAEALRFADNHRVWLEQAIQRQAARPARPLEWTVGTEILFRGEPVKLEAGTNSKSPVIRLAGEQVKVADPRANLRPTIEKHLWKLAARELPPLVRHFAAQHQLIVRRISVRNQRSRWGSCSRRGTISLNWRLIQAPELVRDYIILHELMHLRQMNHSARYWREVASVFPEYPVAERWLKQHASLLR